MHDEVEIVSDLFHFLTHWPKEETLMVVGGGEVYRQSMPFTDAVWLTRVHHAFNGDTFYPLDELNGWKTTSIEHHPIDDKHAYAFDVCFLEKN